ncbi:lysis protein [Pseudomonas citronellolis]|uniref:lysis protein n=1 Tax=Pseudomonas citronellolis TaxID=53408 RepID=UPI0023E3725A|nr:lysis protein [Pseudomonas citronellolis]MDF3932950.1 lysis protein [Pseudomonas citronellolis]
MAVLSWLGRIWPMLLGGFIVVAMIVNGQARYDDGFSKAKALGDAALAELREQHSQEAAKAAQDNLVQLRQQITRADLAEQRMLEAQQQLADAQHQLQERIPHVTTVYRPAPAAAPVAIPHCVFTRGFLRDFNIALGAGLPAAGASTSAAGAQAAAWPTPGSDAELLESGVSPADILAFAKDYGAWAQRNLAQLNALIDQGE